jgi:hypothetical protein
MENLTRIAPSKKGDKNKVPIEKKVTLLPHGRRRKRAIQ